MAGPTVCILLKERMTQLQRDAVWSYIAGFAEEVLPAEHFFRSNGRPFVLGWDSDFGVGEYVSIPLYETAIGWTPQDSLDLGAMCKQKEDHRELARLAIGLAREYDGLIWFGGSLGKDAESLPGRLWKIYGDEDLTLPDWAQLLRYDHVGDADFLDNWLTHPGFRMIK